MLEQLCFEISHVYSHEKMWPIFSSPEPKAEGELLWSLTIRRRRHRPSVSSQSLNISS